MSADTRIIKIVRFWDKALIGDSIDCWPWQGARLAGGYGRFWLCGKMQQAHRVSYELLRHKISSDLVIDHLCRNPCCVNPWHMEPVTNKENILRGSGFSAIHARKTRCIRGHEYTKENTRINKLGRSCKECKRENDRKYTAEGKRKRRNYEY